MEPLGREDWVREVTEGSKAAGDGEQEEEGEDEADGEEESGESSGSAGRLKGTGVVVFLFKDSYVSLTAHGPLELTYSKCTAIPTPPTPAQQARCSPPRDKIPLHPSRALYRQLPR